MEFALVVVSCVAALAVVVAFVMERRARIAARRREDVGTAMDDRLRWSEARRAVAFDRLPLAALRVDGDTRLLEVSARARDRFPHLRPGMGLLEAFGEHQLAEHVAAALSRGGGDVFEVRLFADVRRTYRATVEVYAVPQGAEALVFLGDLTEAVAYQELRSQFVANVSHELRTPLTGLRGLMEALEDPGMDEGTRARFVARATAETLRLEALITDILFLSELEATHGVPAEAQSELTAVVAETVESLAGAAAAARVAVHAGAAEPVWTPLSERMARTVVRNLVENAIRYAGPDTRVDVSLERVAGTCPEGDVVLCVSDDGAGIPERHVPHVFERFYRVDPSRSTRVGGTGLGLSIVKHIAERFGGEATATSREGFGTTIRVRLPVGAAPDAGRGHPPDRP